MNYLKKLLTLLFWALSLACFIIGIIGLIMPIIPGIVFLFLALIFFLAAIPPRWRKYKLIKLLIRGKNFIKKKILGK